MTKTTTKTSPACKLIRENISPMYPLYERVPVRTINASQTTTAAGTITTVGR